MALKCPSVPSYGTWAVLLPKKANLIALVFTQISHSR